MRRFLCILLCIVLLFSTFALTAYADSDFSVWDFILSAYCDIYYTNNVASDPDKLVDFWESNPGKAATLFNLFKGRPGLLAIPSIMAVKDLNEASDARYMVAQLHKEQVEGLYDSFYDYWSNDSAEIRNMSLDEIGITFSADSTISVHGAFGYVGGSGTSVLRGTDYNGGSYMRFVPPDDFQPDSNSLYVYNGSPWYPAVIYVSTKNTIYHGGKALPVGYYYVLNSAQLLYIGVLVQGTTSFCAVYETDSSDNVKNFYPHLFLSSGGGSNKSFNVYTSGSSVSLRQNAADGYMTYEDALRLYSKAVGIHVTTDDKLDSLTITPPEDIPYDDDDNVVMMLPVDEPGEPVFMSPTVYNNYVDNGNVYNTDDHSNNVVNGDTVSNITNIYYNYITNNNTGSTYDDTKLLDKLDSIIDYLKKIYKKIKGRTTNFDIQFDIGDLLGADNTDRDLLELDWKSLIQTKLPLLAEAAQVVRGFEESNSPLSIESDVPLPFPIGDNKTIHFALDFTWYDENKYKDKTGREYVREGLSYIIYVAAFVTLYRRTDMLFADY